MSAEDEDQNPSGADEKYMAPTNGQPGNINFGRFDNNITNTNPSVVYESPKVNETEINDLPEPEVIQNETTDQLEKNKNETPAKEAHEAWRDQMFAKYAEKMPAGIPACLTSLATIFVLFGGGPENALAFRLTGVEQIATLVGPAAAAEVADLIPRVMVKIQENRERAAQEKASMRPVYLREINGLQSEIAKDERELAKRTAEHERFMTEASPESNKQNEQRYFGITEKWLQKWINENQKSLTHKEKIYNKKYGEG